MSRAQTHRRKLIVTTGDTTDFDGFLSLVLYSCVPNADTMFIMNYPADFNPSVRGIPESFAGQPFESSEFGKGFQWNRPNTDTTSFRSKFFNFLRSVWPKGISNKLFLVEGSTHDINPFAPETYQNPEKVFESVLTDSSVSSSDSIPDIGDYEEVFVDMNGSVAFYDSHSDLFNWMQTLLVSGKFKALHVMGGVLDDEMPGTLGAFRFKTNDGINRFSCATMNQLYAPAMTMLFLDDCNANGVPITVISNNLISTVACYTDYREFKAAMQPILSCSNELFLRGFEAFYEKAKSLKAYDVVASLSLISDTESCLQSPKSRLFFNPVYGITLVSKEADTNSEAIENYTAQLQKKINQSPGLPQTMIHNYSAECKLLRDNSEVWQFKIYNVFTPKWTREEIVNKIHVYSQEQHIFVASTCTSCINVHKIGS